MNPTCIRIDLGCKPTKKFRNENLTELGVAEAKQHGEVKGGHGLVQTNCGRLGG